MNHNADFRQPSHSGIGKSCRKHKKKKKKQFKPKHKALSDEVMTMHTASLQCIPASAIMSLSLQHHSTPADEVPCPWTTSHDPTSAITPRGLGHRLTGISGGWCSCHLLHAQG